MALRGHIFCLLTSTMFRLRALPCCNYPLYSNNSSSKKCAIHQIKKICRLRDNLINQLCEIDVCSLLSLIIVSLLSSPKASADTPKKQNPSTTSLGRDGQVVCHFIHNFAAAVPSSSDVTAGSALDRRQFQAASTCKFIDKSFVHAPEIA